LENNEITGATSEHLVLSSDKSSVAGKESKSYMEDEAEHVGEGVDLRGV